MKGVTAFAIGSGGGGGGFAGEVSLAPGATDIADLTSGYSLAAEVTGFPGKIIGLNFYPPSSNVNPFSWPATLAALPILTDSAVLSGGYQETGTITFTLKAPDGTTLDTETATVRGDDTYTTATGYTLPIDGAPGTYQWNATYSGDSNNNSTSDNNNLAEQVTVSPAQTTPPTFTADTPRQQPLVPPIRISSRSVAQNSSAIRQRAFPRGPSSTPPPGSCPAPPLLPAPMT
jgi:hypothetical protein